MSLLRHSHALFTTGWTAEPQTGRAHRVRPLGVHGPDATTAFVAWARFTAADATGEAQLHLEVSPDGVDWSPVSTLKPRDKPYLVALSHVLPFLRARVEATDQRVRAAVQLLANVPFELLPVPVPPDGDVVPFCRG